MDLETAAQIGEALGGIAILLTMLFGLRQILEWNHTRRGEITERIAAHLSTPMVQRGMGVIANELKEGFTVDDVLSLSREEKNAINSILVGLNSHAIMVFQGHLSMDIVCAYYQPYSMILDNRFRKLAKFINSIWINSTDNAEQNGVGPFDWVIWLLDRMDEQPKANLPAYEQHKNWKA